MLAPWKKIYDQPREHIKKQRHYFVDKGSSSQSYGFSSGHVWMWSLDYKENGEPRNWCFWTVVLEKTLESPWTAGRANQSILKEISPEYSLGGLMLKWKLPIPWPPGAKNWLIGKDPDAGKDWRWEEKGTTEDEMVGRHHWLDEHEFEQAQGGLACCSPWGLKESDVTELLTWTELRLPCDCQGRSSIQVEQPRFKQNRLELLQETVGRVERGAVSNSSFLIRAVWESGLYSWKWASIP